MPAVHRSTLVSRVIRNHLEAAGGSSRMAAAAQEKRRGKTMTSQQKALKTLRRGGDEYDVFISHRGVDTKRTVAALLYDSLVRFGLRPFLDSRAMGPGDKLFETINAGVRQSKVGIAVLSPRYCESVFCLQELAMLVESGKKLIPLFCDVKPSELRIGCQHSDVPLRPEELQRFERALQEARYTVGLTFDSQTGNWSDLVSTTVDAVLRCMREETVRSRGH